MDRKKRGIFKYIHNQNGLTLIELLTATSIFLLVVIPLSGVYLSGVNTFTMTDAQTNLRSELDFVTADIMKKVQDASYFDLVDTGDEDKDTLTNLFKIDTSTSPVMNTGVAVFSVRIGDPTDAGTISTVTKEVYQFQPSTSSLTNTFNYNQDKYWVFGLFQLDSDPNSNNNQTQISNLSLKNLTVYILIAPKIPTGTDPMIQQGKPMAFHNLGEIKDAINSGNPYIRIVRTKIAVNNIRQG